MTTKPEGPAQERCADCDECARMAYSDATTPGFFYDKCAKHRVPATPAPSQPAAREFGLDAAVGEIIRQVYGPYASTMNADERKTARDTLSEIVSRYAREQTAAKDAEHDKHIAEFQQAIYEACKAVARECGQPDHAIDGAGSDGGEIEFTVTEVKQAFDLLRDAKEAAERERDSLREDNDEAYRQLGLEDYEGEDGLAHHIAILQAQLAALKGPGKDGQK